MENKKNMAESRSIIFSSFPTSFPRSHSLETKKKKKRKRGQAIFLFLFSNPTFQTFSVLFSLARKDTKRAYRDPRTLAPLGTAAFGTALGIGSRGFFFYLFSYPAKIIPIKYSLPPQHTQSQAARRRVKRPVKRPVAGALFFSFFSFLKRKGQ